MVLSIFSTVRQHRVQIRRSAPQHHNAVHLSCLLSNWQSAPVRRNTKRARYSWQSLRVCCLMERPDFKLAKVQLALDTKAKISEGPTWLETRQELAFVDIEGKSVHIWSPKDGVSWKLDVPGRPGTLSPTLEPHLLLVAMEQEIYLLDLEKRQLGEKIVAIPEPLRRSARFNDGKASPAGSFIVGTVHNQAIEGQPGQLFLLAGGPSGPLDLVQVLSEAELKMANGICWTEGMHSMWHCDTSGGCIKEYRCDKHGAPERDDDGSPSCINQIDIPNEAGFPDGMTIDSCGRLWVALFEGSAVACYDSNTGKYLGKLDMPVRHPTCPIFGGPKLDTMYVTCKGEEPEKGAGGVFAATIPGVHGVAASYLAKITSVLDGQVQ
ncbi:hypothetical protein WJX74_008749 [Apatococcus lobatus]|uniref:SMP-30/Gluconolactonase/LRE-like region domain-containing protein n=2 Tax=Apatococcus TaxID=904362 RepID=A0AAW1SJD2_9CHLO